MVAPRVLQLSCALLVVVNGAAEFHTSYKPHDELDSHASKYRRAARLAKATSTFWMHQYEGSSNAVDIPVLWGSRNRPFRKGLRVIVEYKAKLGAFNQWLAHFNALIFTIALGGEMMLADALYRDTFSAFFVDTKFEEMPLSELLDVDSLVEYWASRGTILHKKGQIRPLSSPSTGKIAQGTAEGEADLIIDTDMSIEPRRDLAEAVANAEGRIRALVSARLEEDPGREIDHIYFRLGDPFNAFNITGYEVLAAEVALSMVPPEKILAMAAKVLQGLSKGRSKFNGLHLRLEHDAYPTGMDIEAMRKSMFQTLLAAMKKAKFSRQTSLYAASGLGGYNHKELSMYSEEIKKNGLAGNIYTKEDFLTPDELKGLKSEQVAMLDFVVLLRAQKFVGSSGSSFSLCAVEYRTLQGIAPERSVLHEGPNPTTMQSFAVAAMQQIS